MKYHFFVFGLLFCLHYSTPLFSQNKINQYKNKERQGIWITYHDTAKTKIESIGRYRNGIQKGKWKYFSSDGNLIKKDRYILRTTYTTNYFNNGKIKTKGKSKLIVNDTFIHYYYYGKWLVYDSLGELTKKENYTIGKLISEKDYKTSSTKNLNDSLVMVLKNLNKMVYKYSDSLTLAEKNFGIKSKQYLYYVGLNNDNGLEIMNGIDKVFSKYGYPTKAMVGTNNSIPFSIISYADNFYKEKYYNLIIDAADKGELEWNDVAFFVDKVKVAKREKQIYGTQYKIENSVQKYYPIKDKTTLNDRRKKVKLEQMVVSEIDDSAGY